jgi:hypothetical protein
VLPRFKRPLRPRKELCEILFLCGLPFLLFLVGLLPRILLCTTVALLAEDELPVVAVIIVVDVADVVVAEIDFLICSQILDCKHNHHI